MVDEHLDAFAGGNAWLNRSWDGVVLGVADSLPVRSDQPSYRHPNSDDEAGLPSGPIVPVVDGDPEQPNQVVFFAEKSSAAQVLIPLAVEFGP